jgi:hypothetical protein
MNPDTTLEWILRLSASLDASVQAGRRVDRDSVYTLVGLIEELDRWLVEGGTAPSRWQAQPKAGTAQVPSALVLDAKSEASNDTASTSKTKVPSPRRGLARRRGNRAVMQLALPFALRG